VVGGATKSLSLGAVGQDELVEAMPQPPAYPGPRCHHHLTTCCQVTSLDSHYPHLTPTL
jgi:hypothetical protein